MKDKGKRKIKSIKVWSQERVEELLCQFDELYEEENIEPGNLFEHKKQSQTESENFFECEQQEHTEKLI